MRKVLIILWFALSFLQNFSAKAQNLTDIEYTTAWAYDIWTVSDKDKDIYVYYQNVNINPPMSIPIDLIYSYDYKKRELKFLTNNSNNYVVLSKKSNKKVNQKLKKCSFKKIKGEEQDKLMVDYRKMLKAKFQHLNDSVWHMRDIVRKKQEREKAIEDSIRIAKESKKHIKFMGIELDGAVDLVMLDLRKKGFEMIDIRKEGYAMSGKFMDRNAIVTLHTTPESNNIYMVNVVFDEEDSWYSLRSEFLNVVKSYRAKYKCINSSRTFFEPYYEGDGFELQGVAKDKCCYFDKYETEGGTIYIEINEMKRIFIKYIDTFNSKRNEREIINKNLDEI